MPPPDFANYPYPCGMFTVDKNIKHDIVPSALKIGERLLGHESITMLPQPMNTGAETPKVSEAGERLSWPESPVIMLTSSRLSGSD
jgi:hypothetical protein